MCKDAGRVVRWVLCIGVLAGGLRLEGDERASRSAVKEVAAAEGIVAAHRALGRGVNLGNALEAPREGDWGLVLASEFFELIRKAGFSHVRVPTKWSAHASQRPPYSIDPRFAERVDWVLDRAQAQGLRVVLNVHHYDELDNTPDEELPRAVAIWEQIATRYRNRGDWLYFELMNEPHGRLNEEGRWNRTLPALLKAVRMSNRTRPVIVGPAWWNGIDALDEFQVPHDPNLIVTVHFYLPFPFTHQGASWVEGSDKWIGRRWGSPSDERELAAIFAKA
ncbi:MAG: glycoside hydrolase family 5 protein, partial [Pirellulaceae bacterium]